MDWTALQARTTAACLAAFGASASAPITLGGVVVQAVWEDDYTRASAGSLGMDTSSPALLLATSLVPTAYEGVPVTRLGVSYTAAHHQPDGQGLSVLFLERAP